MAAHRKPIPRPTPPRPRPHRPGGHRLDAIHPTDQDPRNDESLSGAMDRERQMDTHDQKLMHLKSGIAEMGERTARR